jgi:ATP-binding cassette subfamily B (MDR/TAP) protein 1
MKEFGDTKKILGMEIVRDREKDRVSLTQKQYLQKVLQKYNINDDTKSVNVPLAHHFKLSAKLSLKYVEEHESMTHVPYASDVGSLMYAMVCTWPEFHRP